MRLLRASGLSHIYLDKTETSGFTDIAAGTLVRALGHGLKCAYIDCSSQKNSFVSLLENLSLSTAFVKSFSSLSLDSFTLKNDKTLTKGMIPLVEYHLVPIDIFWNSLQSYDFVCFDNLNFESFDSVKLLSFLRSRHIETEILCVTREKNLYEKIESEFDLSYEINKNKSTFGTLKGSLLVEGLGGGTSRIGFGVAIRSYIAKKNVRILYFDKGDKEYGEMKFFMALKKGGISTKLYGSFDFTSTGIPRYNTKEIREGVEKSDEKEVIEGLKLFQTGLRKEGVFIVDNLDSIMSGLLTNSSQVLEYLSKNISNLIMVGKNFPKEISECFVEKWSLKEIKKKDNGAKRKGIDF